MHKCTILGKIIAELIPEKFINEKEKNVMKFSNAAKGVSKIFTAEILGLIAFVLMGIGSIAVIGAAASSGDTVSNAAAGSIVGGGILATIGAIIMIIGAIINIVGLVQAGKDEPFFKYALYAMIIYFIVSLIISIALSASGSAKDYASNGGTLINLIVNVLVIQGIINLANAKQDAKVAQKGLLIFKLIIVVTVLQIIASIIGVATQSTAAAVVVLVLAIVALVLGIIRYFIYLSMLSNAKKMLADDAE